MMSDMTPRWELPMLFAGQAQKELFHNEALTRIDMLLHGMVEAAGVTIPPASPVVGQAWIVGVGASGAWEARGGSIACWTDGGWRFVTSRAGLTLHAADRGYTMVHDGTAWREGPFRSDGIYIEGVRVVGMQRAAVAAPAGGGVIDGEARVAIGAILDALRAHGLIHT